MQLPAAFTGSLAVEKLLAGEIIFALTCKLYLETICAKYTGYLQWSLPLPIPAALHAFEQGLRNDGAPAALNWSQKG